MYFFSEVVSLAYMSYKVYLFIKLNSSVLHTITSNKFDSNSKVEKHHNLIF